MQSNNNDAKNSNQAKEVVEQSTARDSFITEEANSKNIELKTEQKIEENSYTNSHCLIKKSSAKAQAKHNDTMQQINKESLEQEKLGNTYNMKQASTNIDNNTRAGAGGKFFSDCPKIGNNSIQDKFFVVTKSAGEDYNLSYSELITSIKKDLAKEMLQEKIGHIHFNTSNHLNFRDNPSYQTKYFEYLMLDGRELKTKDYPELAEFFYAGNNATFNLPDMKDGTLRNIKRGTGRANGSFQDDAMQRITGSITKVATWVGNEGIKGAFRQTEKANALTLSPSQSQDRIQDIDFDASRVARTDVETRMKNMGVQAYICAKVLI